MIRMRMKLRSRRCGLAASGAAVLVLWAGQARAAEPPPTAETLGDLSIEELSQVKVTSVSKRPERLNQAASSIYVITNDALRQAGAISLAEGLRLAPQLEVMRIDALDYSITARGSAGFESANKLLVLIDGRSVYTPLFSGVDWDQHQVLLDDVERIEVVSGPGGALWGANAVNGVINVTTKNAFDTRGLLASANLGTLDRDVRLRWGGALGDIAAGRVYATAFRRGDLDLPSGASANDGWDGWQTGFRIDVAGDRDALTLQGDLQDADIDDNFGMPGYVRGGNLLARWGRRFGETAALEVQGYFDRIERETRLIHDEQDVWDLQVQGSAAIAGRHQVVAGAGFRVTKDEFRTLNDPQLLSPPRRRTEIGNVFLQDEVALTPDLLLTAGLKLETNSYTKAEWMPSLRLAWRAREGQFFWASVNRAIRNPSRIERDFTIAGVVVPGRMKAEKLLAYELGWRGRLAPQATASVTLFYHDYDKLRTNELTRPGVLPIFVGNGMEGETYGVEAWTDVQVTESWRVSAGGVIMGKEMYIKPGALDLALYEGGGADPHHWGRVTSHHRIGSALTFEWGVRYQGDVPALRAAGYVGADAYVEAQARLAWRVREGLELSVTGLNLLHERHREASETRGREIPRSVRLGLRWTP